VQPLPLPPPPLGATETFTVSDETLATLVADTESAVATVVAFPSALVAGLRVVVMVRVSPAWRSPSLHGYAVVQSPELETKARAVRVLLTVTAGAT
jgi:hypothetical protein